ncbi:hypothetical protein [Sphingomonas montanisoli]|uniref:Energy transducer TonB n=1 Tax=Sphingomonas montanisoli TaxID=2606412 RepID=A0A5D9C413_9SPHN|nr:hypothetical protein [Sphingomonas montanisoli]TZG26588.1 hypothetical protein FYJ91_14905 [Sphingomonas montanisoli]
MRAVLLRFSADPHAPSVRRRAVTLTIVAIIHALLLWAFLTLAPTADLRKSGLLKNFSLIQIDSDKQEEKKAARAQKEQEKTPTVTVQRASAPTVPPPTPETRPLNMIVVSSEDFRAGDISNVPRPSGAAAGNAQVAENGDAANQGQRAPNGERLYDAAWYREPTDAEMATYMPKRQLPDGAWGDVYCRTAPDWRVEDCHELGESPPGSGLARAVRLASWQFKVRPPRVGGKTQIGTWVRIRFDIVNRKTAD